MLCSREFEPAVHACNLSTAQLATGSKWAAQPAAGQRTQERDALNKHKTLVGLQLGCSLHTDARQATPCAAAAFTFSRSAHTSNSCPGQLQQLLTVDMREYICSDVETTVLRAAMNNPCERASGRFAGSPLYYSPGPQQKPYATAELDRALITSSDLRFQHVTARALTPAQQAVRQPIRQ